MVTNLPEMVTEMVVSCWEREKWRHREREEALGCFDLI
jgi:hypothetical protein